MGMTLKADVAAVRKQSGDDKPVDLVHLSSQTMGDRGLEIELLKLFIAQAPTCLEAWARASDMTGRKHAAHALKGASRAVGAFVLGDLAAEAELPGFSGFARLEAEIRRVDAYIRTII